MLPLWIQNLGMGTPGEAPPEDGRAAVVIIAEAVVNALNAATLSLPFDAARAYDVTREIRFAGVKIDVLPEVLIVSAPDLMPRKYLDWQMTVWIQKVAETVEDIDPLMLLVQEIIILFAFKPLATTVARCIAVENGPPTDADRLNAKGIFSTAIRFTFRWPIL